MRIKIPYILSVKSEIEKLVPQLVAGEEIILDFTSNFIIDNDTLFCLLQKIYNDGNTELSNIRTVGLKTEHHKIYIDSIKALVRNHRIESTRFGLHENV